MLWPSSRDRDRDRDRDIMVVVVWAWARRLAASVGGSWVPPGATPPTVPMSEPPAFHDQVRVVARGGPADGVCWSISAGPAANPDRGFFTLVTRERDGYHASSGMGGPALPEDGPVNTWHGCATGLPPFVLLRADPTVQAVTVHTALGRRHRLELSDTVTDFELRFAAGPLHEGDDPVELTIALEDGTEWTTSYRQPECSTDC